MSVSPNLDVLFCPFCREGFRGRSHCPEHDLVLLAEDELPPDESAIPELVTLGDPRFGRAWLALGALLVFVGFFLPLLAYGAVEVSAYRFASSQAPNLWMIAAGAVGGLWLLVRFRAPRRMRRLRLVALTFAVYPLMPLGYTFYRLFKVAEAGMAAVPRAGFYVIVAGVLFASVGALRFGVPSIKRHSS